MLGFGKKGAFNQVEQWVDVIRVAIAQAILLESRAVDDRERGIVATMANLITCSPNARNSEEETRLALERLPSILAANQDVRRAAVVCLRACCVTRGTEYSNNAIQWIADSERCRSAFRGDGDRDSDVMPITIPS
jgi:hypothetical protein